MPKVVLGYSGGVDSFFALYLLLEEGYEVIPVFIKLLNDVPESVFESLKIFGIEPVIVERQKLFEEKVVKPFVEYYRAGLTPNPCAVCNREVKFKTLLDLKEELKADFVATGHYASVKFFPELKANLIVRGVEEGKEQSYFLALVEKRVLEFLLLPLGKFAKKEVVERAKGLGFKWFKESQDVCFVEGDRVSFLIRFIGESPGVFVLEDGKVVGKYKEHYRYTVGQRRGLGISWKEKLYVLRIEPEKGRIVVGSKDRLEKRVVCLKNLNWHVLPSLVRDLKNLKIQVRYRSHAQNVEYVKYFTNEIFCVKLRKTVSAPAEGQVGAIYSGTVLLGGGEIFSSEE